VTQPDLNELVALARRDRPSPSALMAVARKLRLPFEAAGVVLAPSVALGSVATKGGLTGLAVLGAVAGSFVAVTGVVAAVTLREPPPAPRAPVVAPALRVATPPSELQKPEASGPETQAPEPAPSAERRLLREAPASWDEPQLIERARKALSTEPRRALALTREHQLRFPTGALGVERDVIALQALARTGQTAEARRRALAFEARYPKSIHLPQVRALLRRLDAP
jgi:hypothetical protein